MGVQAILDNVRTVGIKETYHISRKRKQERITDHKVADQLRRMLSELAAEVSSKEAAELMRKGAAAKEDDEVRQILKKLDKMKNKAYRQEMKRIYIKEILPGIYEDFKRFHVEDTVYSCSREPALTRAANISIIN